MTESITAVIARVTQLTSQIRALDPTFTGPTFAGPTFAGPTFSTILGGLASTAAATPASGDANAVPDEAAPTAAADGSDLMGAAGNRLIETRALGVLAAASTSEARTTTTSIDPAYVFTDPLRGGRRTQDFGPTSFGLEPPLTLDGHHYAHFHQGIDVAAHLGTPVRAAAAGVVILAGRVPDGAVDVRIRHADGSETLYGHLQVGLDVHVGQKVDAGDKLGEVGMTGNTTGPHLHFALYRHGRPIDPDKWLDKGRLPGTPKSAMTAAVADPAASGALVGDAALARFDAIADQIPYAAEIRAAAIKAKIDPLLFASLVRAESGFRPNAVSSAGAMGMTQLMPATAKALKVDDPFDPVQNLKGGAKYLAGDLRIYGRVDLALAAYQAGKGAVARAGGIPDSPTTHHYIDRILGYWAGYLKKAAA